MDRATGRVFKERISTWIQVALSISRVIPKKGIRAINDAITFRRCAKDFHDPTKGKDLIRKFIQQYSVSSSRGGGRGKRGRGVAEGEDASPPHHPLHDTIELHEIEKPLRDYRTLNEFFQRRLRPGARPISAARDPRVMVVPADSRCSIFPSVTEAHRLWIKGNQFSLPLLFGVDRVVDLPPDLRNDPAVVVCRLAPQDYHRYHFPAECAFTGMRYVGKEYYSVNPIMVKSKSTNVFTVNRRAVTYLETEAFGTIGFVSVGATCTGSIQTVARPGPKKRKGGEFGTFGFGGSTVILVVDAKRVRFAQELLWASAQGMETLVRVGQWLGMAATHPCQFASVVTPRA